MVYVDTSQLENKGGNQFYLKQNDLYVELDKSHSNVVKAWYYKPDDFGEMTRTIVKAERAEKILIESEIGFE